MSVYLEDSLPQIEFDDLITIDCKKIKTEADLYDVVYPLINAPEWSGHNLDAFHETVRYIQEYFPKKDHISIAFTNWNKIFRNDKNKEKLVVWLISQFASAAEHSNSALGDDNFNKPSVGLGVYLIK